jgi:hypothetical protein
MNLTKFTTNSRTLEKKLKIRIGEISDFLYITSFYFTGTGNIEQKFPAGAEKEFRYNNEQFQTINNKFGDFNRLNFL